MLRRGCPSTRSGPSVGEKARGKEKINRGSRGSVDRPTPLHLPIVPDRGRRFGGAALGPAQVDGGVSESIRTGDQVGRRFEYELIDWKRDDDGARGGGRPLTECWAGNTCRGVCHRRAVDIVPSGSRRRNQ